MRQTVGAAGSVRGWAEGLYRHCWWHWIQDLVKQAGWRPRPPPCLSCCHCHDGSSAEGWRPPWRIRWEKAATKGLIWFIYCAVWHNSVCVCVPWSGWADQVSSVGFKCRDVVTLGPLQRHKDTISDNSIRLQHFKQTLIYSDKRLFFFHSPSPCERGRWFPGGLLSDRETSADWCLHMRRTCNSSSVSVLCAPCVVCSLY